MSDALPASAPVPEQEHPVSAAPDQGRSGPEPRSRPRINALAVAALILAILLSPLAALFGHLAAGQIARSRGHERGAVMAWIAVGMGYLWVVAAIVAGIAGVILWQGLIA